jgi:putative transposase
VVALGITTEGVKVPLGLWEGSTENAAVATALLADLVDRGLAPPRASSSSSRRQGASQGGPRRARPLDAGPVLRAPQGAKRLDHLPERDRPQVKRRLRRAWTRTDHTRAREELAVLASELERSHPGAASSLREGLEETLTVTRLGVGGALARTLQSTNPCESMIECVRPSSRNLKRRQSGEMCPRWTAAGMLEAERQFRRIVGYRELAKLAVAVERQVAASTCPAPRRRRRRSPLHPHEVIHGAIAVAKFHGGRECAQAPGHHHCGQHHHGWRWSVEVT